MRRKLFLSVLPLPLVLAACMGSDCTNDPRLDGLATAAGCTFGGGYKAETDNLRAVALERTQLASELKAENRAISSQLTALNDRERELANRLIAVNNDLASLDSRLAQQLRQQQISQAEYDLKLSQLEDLNAQRRSVNPGDAQASQKISQLESEIADLKRFLG